MSLLSMVTSHRNLVLVSEDLKDVHRKINTPGFYWFHFSPFQDDMIRYICDMMKRCA